MERRDMVMMKDGKMMILRNDQLMPMQMDMTMSDGTKVMMDGTLMLPDGSSRMLTEGESMTIDGKIAEGRMDSIEADREDKTEEL